ncbi:hypothetical protein [Stigmatella aurantiaca]|uniref:Conserved uncharacterized protein n=1 Tax=Stigmatella aurantiaca (strain DW4/3-1) TaxID=378806 RepID=E3FIH3_STIAD|nr:hypothetical protein [Stigmatella aurantiaca]ADO74134.1 conserved uncharacterized protein [Stigmatella aurantiaca DW4/3-1]
MKRLVPVVLLGCVLAASAAPAQEASSYGRAQGWSALAADTVGVGNTAIVGQAGWPGLSLAVLRGTWPDLDLGGRFSFNYGQEGLVEIVEPGLKFQGYARLKLLQLDQVALAATFQPGLFFYFHEGSDDVGLTLPAALVVGIPVGSALMVNVGLEVPFHVYFGEDGGAVVPVLVGGGLEYFIDRNLAVTANVRMGPSLVPGSGRGLGGESAYFTLETLLGVAVRL